MAPIVPLHALVVNDPLGAVRPLFTDHTGAAAAVDTRLYLLYFSASWCGPCRAFTPVLKDAYAASANSASGPTFDVIFVSSDRSQEEYDEYRATMPWKALPFAQTETRDFLKTILQISGIPRVVVLDATGAVRNADARSAVQHRPRYPSSWCTPWVGDFSTSPLIRGIDVNTAPTLLLLSDQNAEVRNAFYNSARRYPHLLFADATARHGPAAILKKHVGAAHAQLTVMVMDAPTHGATYFAGAPETAADLMHFIDTYASTPPRRFVDVS